MREYTFTLILSNDPTDEQVERLYGFFGAGGDAPESVQDMTLAVRAGVPLAGCTVLASSFEEALRDVLPGLRAENLDVVRVELEKEDIGVLETV